MHIPPQASDAWHTKQQVQQWLQQLKSEQQGLLTLM